MFFFAEQWLDQRESDGGSFASSDNSLPHEHDVERVVTLYNRADDLLTNVNSSAEIVKVCRLVLLVRTDFHLTHSQRHHNV